MRADGAETCFRFCSYEPDSRVRRILFEVILLFGSFERKARPGLATRGDELTWFLRCVSA